MNQTLLKIATTSIALIGLAIFPSCGRGSDGDSAAGPRSSTSAFRLSQSQLQESLASASDFERPLLQDGLITFEEYEQATFAAIECFKGAGFTIGPGDGPEVPEGTEGPRLTKRGKYGYNPISPPNYSIEQFSIVVDDCKTKHTGVIDFFWAVKSAPTQEELQAARRAIATCLRGAGVDIPEDPSSVELVRVAYPPDGKPQPGQGPPGSYTACAVPVAIEFDLPGFLG